MSKNQKNKVGVVSNANKKLEYLYILDRSGSMGNVRQQTIDNVNEQINVIKKAAKDNNVDANITILLFDQRGYTADEWFKYLFIRTPVANVEPITEAQYEPHGGTPLRDAIGKGVTDLQAKIGDELGSPDLKVLVTVFTDGEENSSITYSSEQIKQMVEHLSSDGKFVFSFVGAGNLGDVTAVSQKMGIIGTNTMAYANNLGGHKMAATVMCRSVSNFMNAYSAGADVTQDYFAAPALEENDGSILKAGTKYATSAALDDHSKGDLLKNIIKKKDAETKTSTT